MVTLALAAALIAAFAGRGDRPAPIVVDDPATLFVAPHLVPTLAEPRWLTHRLRPRDTLERVAARYGVSVAELREWNGIKRDGTGIRNRRALKVLARRAAPPPQKIVYVVKAAENWDDVAAKLHVPRRALQARNRGRDTLVAGTRLIAWVDPLDTPAFDPEAPDLDANIVIPSDARSVGLPQKGRLEGGTRLPESPLWRIGQPARAFASSHTIAVITRAFTTLRNDMGYRGTITIGALSRPHGGRFRPHQSHQSGRDIDIRLPLRPGIGDDVRHPTVDDIDWYAAWAMVDAFIRTGEVEAVFLEIGRHERLYTAARVMGVPRAQLVDLVRWTNWSGPVKPLVLHSDGHDTHIHVRIRCGRDEPRCRTDGDKRNAGR